MWSHSSFRLQHLQRLRWSSYSDWQYIVTICDNIWLRIRSGHQRFLHQVWRIYWRTQKGFRRHQFSSWIYLPNLYWVYDLDNEDWRRNQVAGMRRAIYKLLFLQKTRQGDIVFLWWVWNRQIDLLNTHSWYLHAVSQKSMWRISDIVRKRSIN